MTAPSSFVRRHPMRRRRARRRIYPLVGLALSFGAPIGLLFLRGATRYGLAPGFLAREIASDPWLYIYLIGSTGLTLALLGWVLGQREDDLRALAATDGLTMLANRTAFERRLAEEVARAGRYETPLALLLIDLDGLKALNDGFGHRAGDEALRSVAEALRKTARRTDLSARVGGDEFAVLAPETSANEARGLAARLQREVHAMPLPALDAAPIRVSVGIADLELLGTRDPGELWEAADEALYAAKTRGRDRSVVWKPNIHPLQMRPA